jgi:LPXTG-motif cell wall-anchored protein
MTLVRRTMALLTIGLLAMGLLLSSPSAAGAVTNPDYTVPPPTSTVVSTPAPPAARQPVSTAVRVAPLRTRLAITGRETVTMAVVGSALIAGGVAVLAVRRRRLAAG